MKNRYCPIEETCNLEKTLSEVPKGYELHSVVYMSFFDYAHHYTVIWRKTEENYVETCELRDRLWDEFQKYCDPNLTADRNNRAYAKLNEVLGLSPSSEVEAVGDG